MSERVYHLALRELHAEAGAHFAQHGAWSLPEHYGNPEAEHHAVRTGAACFDRSQHSRFMVTGTDAEVVLRRVFSPALEVEEGRAQRLVALDEQGLIRDLALVARTGGISFLVQGAAEAREATMDRLRQASEADFDVRVDDRTESTCLLGVAGPAAADVIEMHVQSGLAGRLPKLGCVALELHGFRALATRTSDLGEDGFELMVAPAVAQHLLETLRSAGVPLAGMAATESARVEACIPAMDPDLSPGLTPAEADIAALLDLPEAPARRLLAAALIDGAPLPAGARVQSGGADVGEVRSCVNSYALGATAAMVIVRAEAAMPGTGLDLAGIPGTIVAKPFYRRRSS